MDRYPIVTLIVLYFIGHRRFRFSERFVFMWNTVEGTFCVCMKVRTRAYIFEYMQVCVLFVQFVLGKFMCYCDNADSSFQ